MGISRRDVELLLLGLAPEGGPEGISGITRFQKLLFLLEQEERVIPSGTGFDFSAYKAGPYSAQLYDDLEMLENLGFIETEVTAEATEEEAAEIDMLDFEELMGDSAEDADGKGADGLGAADAYEERHFRLTDEGKKRVLQLLSRDEYKPVEGAIRRLRSKYGHYALSDLLYYVYTKYPEMTTESEIKDKVLKRRR
jgi:hypothetical protein